MNEPNWALLPEWFRTRTDEISRLRAALAVYADRESWTEEEIENLFLRNGQQFSPTGRWLWDPDQTMPDQPWQIAQDALDGSH